MTQAEELSRSDLDEPGLSRRRSGRGFSYLSPAGERVTDAGTLQRIKALVIPPDAGSTAITTPGGRNATSSNTTTC
jgi:DNA topoisomerase IB